MRPSDTTTGSARVVARLDELGAITETEGELTRRFATPALRAAGDMVAGWMTEAGLVARRDALGNVVGRYEGAAPRARALVIGSHLDTVPDAGRFDGALGVLCGIEAVAHLGAEEERLPFAVEVAAFADEEGARYGTAYLGSSAFAGSFDSAVLERRDADGIPMAEAIAAVGDDAVGIASCARHADELLGYCEIHIEQGPVLEREDLPVGVVSAIAGQTRAVLAVEGEAGHAGTVTMSLRRDALAGAAEIVLAVEAVARSVPDLVATVGDMTVEPGAGNVIPGRVTFPLDVRHPADSARTDAVARLREVATGIAAARRLSLEWDLVLESPAVTTDERLTEALETAIVAAGHRARRLVSGAGHDAAVVASIAPVCLLFVRCVAGISHAPAESATESDIAVALDVLDRTLRGLARS